MPIALFAIMTLFIANFAFAAQTYQEPLLPEVAQIVAVPEPLDINILKQDVYIGLFAIGAPQGIDYMQASAQAMYQNQARLRQALSTQDYNLLNSQPNTPQDFYEDKASLNIDFTIHGKKFYFECSDLQNHQCITQTLSSQDNITALLEKNALLMERYLTITQLPYYSVDSYYYSASTLIPVYTNVIQLSALRLAQAVIAFDSGEVDQALSIFEQERRVTQRMLEDNKTLIGKMVAIRMLYAQLVTLNQLLDTPAMQAHLNNPRLQALFTPLSEKAQRGISQAFETERNAVLYLTYTLDLQTAQPTVNLSNSDEEEESLPPKNNDVLGIRSYLYDNHQTTNVAFLIWQPYIDAANLTLPEYHQKYIINTSPTPEELTQKQLDIALNTGPTFYNYMGKKLLSFSPPSFQEYINRFYDAQVYMALVNLKYEIMREQINLNNVESFLMQAGSIANNPYTQTPFHWNTQTAQLSAPWLYIHQAINPLGEKHMSVTIQPPHTPQAQQKPLIGMANPASQYCIEKGGTLSIVNEPGGQRGICTLPNGTQVEEWELFRRDHPVPPEQAVRPEK